MNMTGLVERVRQRRRELDVALDMCATLERSMARVESRGNPVGDAFMRGHELALNEWRGRALDCMVLLQIDLLKCKQDGEVSS